MNAYLEVLVGRAQRLCVPGARSILGITGPPGAGKSTLARAIANQLGARACVVSMDGFHLANCQLRRLDRLSNKGAIDTFDSEGYVSLLQRLLREKSGVVYAPLFDRELDTAIGSAIAIGPSIEIVVTEGNYLLDDDPPWNRLAGLVSETWFCQLDDFLRTERLVARHIEFGKSPVEAQEWVYESDEVNAARVLARRHLADLIVDMQALEVEIEALCLTTSDVGDRTRGRSSQRESRQRHVQCKRAQA
jgi:pantothenate kinase